LIVLEDDGESSARPMPGEMRARSLLGVKGGAMPTLGVLHLSVVLREPAHRPKDALQIAMVARKASIDDRSTSALRRAA
jgi:hypothetical protein